ncbi:helix-turn-helix domain-containing protein [Dictyobacter aurantiacus]|uniref:Uncharacterized protein n=1 Tax=Dictyobacter aurantiacus TaxID=1936993 RepID=A0A401ZF30_9CHLR|nr:helix-turn-helix domain-containing protein [Dictyobacter aurantiacus]GCE05413.1 hypothetical protein KDAU_27420 [Dictyobacter aurantiacus]
MPRYQPPKGYYTSTQVKEILNISGAMIANYVEKGKIRHVVPPGRKHGYYLKKDVDALARELETFFKLEEETEAVYFTTAQAADIPGCIKLNRELFTTSTSESDALLAEKWTSWIQKNPQVVYVLKRGEDVVGIATILPLKPGSKKFEKVLMADTSILLGDVDISANDIEEYTPGNKVQLYLAEIGIKPSLHKDLRSKYGAKLISNFMDAIVDLGKRGVIVERIVSVGATRSGVRLLQHFGFSEIIFPREDTRVFVIDMKKSGAPITQAYREAYQNFAGQK